MIFKKGDTLYLKTGTMMELEMEADGFGYGYPLLVTIRQQMNYAGDDFYEEEDLERANHLIKVPLGDLSLTPPVAKVDAELDARKKELEQLETASKKALSASRDELRVAQRELDNAKREFAKWQEDHEAIRHTVKLLEGGELFPLHYISRHGVISEHPPVIPDMESVATISMLPTRSERKWRITRRKYPNDEQIDLRFFDTKAEREAFVKDQFDTVVKRWSAGSKNFSTSSYSGLNYGTLQNWAGAWPHLEIPADIVQAKADHDAEQRAAEIELARKRLEALMGEGAADGGLPYD